jgi:excisionase family DNA binding protein
LLEQWERGEATPSIAMVEEIAKLTGTSVRVSLVSPEAGSGAQRQADSPAPAALGDPGIMTLDEVAELLRLNRKTVYELARQVKIPVRRVGRSLRAPHPMRGRPARSHARHKGQCVCSAVRCEKLGINPPSIESVASHREANMFALLIVALFERGEAMTLLEVATRFAKAGIASRESALLSLQRCKPGRPPVYREGDLYHLDPHDDELDLWVFRLGLRPPKVAPVAQRAPDPAPLPGPEVALTEAELDLAFKDSGLSSWSAQRLVLAVLDAHGGPLEPTEVVQAVASRTRWHSLRADSAKFKRWDSAIEVLVDGRWAIARNAGEFLKQARIAIRDRVAAARRHEASRGDPAEFEKRRAEWEQRRAARGAELARLSRALIVAFPAAQPQAAAILDVGKHELETFVGEELAGLRLRLGAYEVLGAMDVRALLRALGFDPGERRLAELGAPQKSKRLNKSGRTLKITPALLVQGSCGISRPFGEAAKLAEYLAKGEEAKLRRRLEADVKSLHALYEYGRLHGAVRLRWGFLDEFIPAPWVDRDEPTLYNLMESAHAMKVPLEVVVGSAPGWAEPWSRVRRAFVEKTPGSFRAALVDEDGYVIDESEVQRARLPAVAR